MAIREIRGCRAIITGASSGIGRALVIELCRQGARCVAVARRRERLDELAAEVVTTGGTLEVVVGDITLAEVRRAALERAKSLYGGLDLLVNNAGAGALGFFSHADEQLLRRVMEVNFFAPAEFIREAHPLLRAGTNPMVVNIGSVLGHWSVPRMSEYGASKFALRGLTLALRAEFVRDGIDVLLVSPARTASEFVDNMLESRSENLWPDVTGASAELVAQRTVRAIRLGRHELFPSWSARFLYWINRLAPWAVERYIAHYEH
ncbi:MAG: SDR family NAD(P)-dependent oxidoreductase [Pirellulales bacterium]|nr:SDR family NAD(P)-dependent oxidoreductase [Pirellulales bacterium]